MYSLGGSFCTGPVFWPHVCVFHVARYHLNVMSKLCVTAAFSSKAYVLQQPLDWCSWELICSCLDQVKDALWPNSILLLQTFSVITFKVNMSDLTVGLAWYYIVMFPEAVFFTISNSCPILHERNITDCIYLYLYLSHILSKTYYSVISHLAGPLEFRGRGTSDRVAAPHIVCYSYYVSSSFFATNF